MTVEALQAAFGDCKRPDSSACSTKSSYESIAHEDFYICDEHGLQPVRIVSASEEHQLKVLNPDNEAVTLVKTDKCLFTDEHKKCDCIIFSREKIYLVEIKDCKTKQRSAQKETAIAQLGTTIEILKQHGLLPASQTVNAVVCFKLGKVYPVQASANTQRIKFRNEYQVDLTEGNEIHF